MKVSINWLSKLVDIKDITPEQLADRLTFAGVEVESIDRLASATGLVIGKVLTCEDVPDSHLHLCQVDLGSKHGVKQIICGAPNVRKGLKVIVAMVGAKLPGVTIGNSIIRGIESDGMICSLLELGVDPKYLNEKQMMGIEELGEDAIVGDEEVLRYLSLDDTVLTLKLLANRSDLNSMENVAKEVATLFERKLSLEETPSHNVVKTTFKAVNSSNKTNQFHVRVVKNIKVNETPKWMKEYLVSSGVRPINSVVDIGNYVMLLTGQPIHMYDLDKLQDNVLEVKDDINESFVALDEKEYDVIPGDICITNNNKTMCLGGVMGSLSCATSNDTKNVVVEAANFDAATVRRTSIRLALSSESSTRFVKGINPNQYTRVLELTTKLLKDICGAEIIEEIVGSDKNNHSLKEIKTSAKDINNILSTDFTYDEIIKTLNIDHIETKDLGNDEFIAYVPYHRIDIDGKNDLAEEVIRINGLSRVKASLPVMETTCGSLTYEQKRKNDVRQYLSGQGLDEVISYVLVKKEELDNFKIINTNEAYKIINPMTDEHEYVRTNLIDSLLKIASYNYAHQNKDLSLFEISDIDSINYQSRHLGIVLLGNNYRQNKLNKVPYNFYHIKGLFEGIMDALGIEPNRYRIERMNPNDELHPGRSAAIYLGRNLLGYFGELHPEVMKRYGFVKTSCQILEVNIMEFLKMPIGVKKVVPPSKYPSIIRDYALLVPHSVSAKDVLGAVKKASANEIKGIDIFDVYEGENVEKGYKSIAISVTYQLDDRTLKDEDIKNIEVKVFDALTKLSIIVRS